MATKRTKKLIFVLIAFIVVIVGSITLIIMLNTAQPIVNSLAFGFKTEEGYERFYYKEVYITGSEEDYLNVKVLVNESLDLSTNFVQFGVSNPALIEIKEGENFFNIIPRAEGKVTISVQSKENLNAMDSCVLDIKQKTIKDISVTKINNVVVGDDNVLNIYNINVAEDNNKYNSVLLNLNNANASSLSVLQYDDSRIEDIYVDPLTFTLQIKTKNVLGSTLVKLGWKELDFQGNEYIVGQQDFVFNICEYKITKIGFDVFTTPDIFTDGVKLQETTLNNYSLNVGTDGNGNQYKLLYIKPYYIYSSGWENRNLNINQDGVNSVCTVYSIGAGTEIEKYYIIDYSSQTIDVSIVFSNSTYSSVYSTLNLKYKDGTFITYFD